MFRRSLAVSALLGALVLLPGPADARGGPGTPLHPKAGRTDAMLYEKAARLEARMWRHLSPEGLLVYRHRLGAGPAELSNDALALSDAAIWTGCYAASQACRWHVTKDPDALAQARHLARGLAALSLVTGEPGCFGRNVGRAIPGEPPGEGTVPSPTGSGLSFRPDASRDQLSGVVLGWLCLHRFVEDPEIREAARVNLAAIARRLRVAKMRITDFRGKRTRYGELRPDVEGVPFVRNGALAAPGLAAAVAAAAVDPSPDLANLLGRLKSDGWDDALDHQFTWVPELMDPSDVNWRNVALLAISLGNDRTCQDQARRGLRALRRATVGWWNAGFCACQLLGGLSEGRGDVVDEVRVVLHVMSEDEVPPSTVRTVEIQGIPTIRERGITDWAWKDALGITRVALPGPAAYESYTYTRADWLFAYWLSRAAGAIPPEDGPGAAPLPQEIPVDLPPWMRDK